MFFNEKLEPSQVLPGVDDFEGSRDVFFTPDLHARLEYFGFVGGQPALVVDLWNSQAPECSPSPFPVGWADISHLAARPGDVFVWKKE